VNSENLYTVYTNKVLLNVYTAKIESVTTGAKISVIMIINAAIIGSNPCFGSTYIEKMFNNFNQI
jgi:hypothetical protein